MPLGFVPVEPISRHSGRRAARGGRTAIGGDGRVRDARAFGGSRVIPCGTGRQLAAAGTAVAAASSIAATDNYRHELSWAYANKFRGMLSRETVIREK